MGPGENAGVVDAGDGLAVAFKVESHNHPSAVEPFQGAATGVGGILRDIFAVGAPPDRGARLAALRRARLGALALPVRGRGQGHRPLRQLDRGADGRRRGDVRARLRAELPRQRDVRRARAPGRPDPQRGGGRRQPARAARRAHRPRRHRRRVGAGQRRALRGGRLEAAERADRRPLRGVEAGRVLPRAARARAAALAAGPRRRGPVLVVVRDGLEGRGGARHRRVAGAAARGATWSPSRS